MTNAPAGPARRAFGVTTDALLAEIGEVDPGLAKRLTGTLEELVSGGCSEG